MLVVMAIGLLGTAAIAQGVEFGVASRGGAQQRYIDRLLTLPPPLVQVVVDDKLLDAVKGKPGTPKGIVFGSFGVSAGWSFGARIFLPELTLSRRDPQASFGVYLGEPGGKFFNTRIQAPLRDRGEKKGLMYYGAFKAELEPGEYEIVEAKVWKVDPMYRSSARQLPIGHFQPVVFTVAPDRPVYLGRFTFVPEVEEVTTRDSRSAREREQMDDRPAYDISGLFLWVQDAADADRRLAEVGSADVLSLPSRLFQENPRVFRSEVTIDQVDHNGKTINSR